MADGIAELLVRSGKLTQERLARAPQEQERSGQPLPEMLIRLGYCNDGDIRRAFAESMGLPILDSSTRPDPDVLPGLGVPHAETFEINRLAVLLDQQNCAGNLARRDFVANGVGNPVERRA